MKQDSTNMAQVLSQGRDHQEKLVSLVLIFIKVISKLIDHLHLEDLLQVLEKFEEKMENDMQWQQKKWSRYTVWFRKEKNTQIYRMKYLELETNMEPGQIEKKNGTLPIKDFYFRLKLQK